MLAGSGTETVGPAKAGDAIETIAAGSIRPIKRFIFIPL